MRHLVTLFDLTPEELEEILVLGADLKSHYRQGTRETILPGRVLALLFEKPSLRTRVSFEAGMTHLGGNTVCLGLESGWQSRESNSDFARVLSQYADCIVARTFEQSTVEELAGHSTCPVINGLTNLYHPCQALSDVFTIREIFDSVVDRKVAFLGDGNNVARSLAIACGKLGMRFALAAPDGYQFDQDFLDRIARDVPMDLVVTADPAEAIADADVIYTDVWCSMGQEAEQAQRKADLADYQVNATLLAQAPAGARFMHCLPAHRGEEVTDEVIDGPNSAVIEQAGNRMHAQKGLLVWLLEGRA